MSPAEVRAVKAITNPRNTGQFGKGNPGKTKGAVDNATREFRETVRSLLESNADNVSIWLQQVAEGVGDTKPAPAKALDLLAKLAEFAAPKLGRVEHVGDGGGPIESSARLDGSGLSTGTLVELMAAKDAAGLMRNTASTAWCAKAAKSLPD